jgi:integrase
MDKLLSMSRGLDPTTEKKRKQAVSVKLKTVSEAYIADRKHLKQASINDIRKHINTSFQDWAERPAADINREMVINRFRELTQKSPAQANLAFRLLRALLNYARASYRTEEGPTLPENPVTALSDAKLWNHIQARANKIPVDRIGHAWNEIQALRTASNQTAASRTSADIVAFLLLTGARWNEAATLPWNSVDMEKGTWHLPDPKNRQPVTFPLSDQAKAILAMRPRKNEFVFCSHSKTGHIVDARAALSKVSEAATAKISPHDLRRTFRAVAGECGIELWKTKLLMNHKLSGDITISAYTETSDLRYLEPDIQKIADWIDRQALLAKNKVTDIQHKRGVA